jgi:hypothetical protein
MLPGIPGRAFVNHRIGWRFHWDGQLDLAVGEGAFQA